MKIKKYTPDFPAMMRIYETNYIQLNRLMPKSNIVGDKVVFQIKLAMYSLELQEVTPYTRLVKIQQSAPKISYWELPELNIRLYDDVRIAEVCASRQISRFRARYDYPNHKGYHPDEKHQINQLLAEWLKFCLKYGTIPISIIMT